jgi:hypothetical protein
MKHSILGAACASLFITLSGTAQAVSVSGQGTWETTLQGRDLDGDFSNGFEAYYDTVLDITWLANANYAGMTMNWSTANAWAAGLTLGGYTDWRLPTTNPIDGTTADDATLSYIGTEDRGYNVSAPGTFYAGSTASEMAYMFYNTLGNLAYCDPATSTVSSCSGLQTGWGLTNTGPFSNVQSNFYWSATEYAPSTSLAWYFDTYIGYQDGTNKPYNLYAWAVHTGDVGASVVPVPAAAWLFGSGLLGLIGVSRKRRR